MVILFDENSMGSKKPDELILCACNCGQTLTKYNRFGHERRYLPQHHSKLLKHTEESKKAISLKMTGRQIEWKDKISEALKGKEFTEEHKQNLSKAKKDGKKWQDEDNPNYIDGRTSTRKGLQYKVKYIPDGKNVLEHRYIFEKHYKCCMLPWGHVHHKNGNKKDNRIENLEGMTRNQHAKLHVSLNL